MPPTTPDKSAITPSTPVRDIPGVGDHRARALSRLGIDNVADLLRYLPMRYEQQSAEAGVGELVVDSIGSVRGEVMATRPVMTGRGQKFRFEATMRDHTGQQLRMVWFNARHLVDKLHPGMMIRIQGKVSRYETNMQMINPRIEYLDGLDAVREKEERIRPVYSATEEVNSEAIERIVADVLPMVIDELVDPLPEGLREAHVMPALSDAWRMAHCPADMDEPGVARRRLAYNELLLLQLGITLKRYFNSHRLAAPALQWSDAIGEHIFARFPFELTDNQRQVIGEVTGDLQHTRPMNRLLQGDVGAGKTVVALYALLLAVANRKQGALMAPTELLAEQHFISIQGMLEESNVRMALLTAGQSTAGSSQRRELLEQIAAGEIDLVIGTQALLAETITFHDLAVVVVDEQHRFGVLQRAKFRTRARKDTGGLALVNPLQRDPSPHYLVMTATPIPRTLSLTIFGDLDVSTIRHLPPGRSPIRTRVVGPPNADEVYRCMADRIAGGEQAYVVVPTIDAHGHESAVQLKNVRAHAKLLAQKYCTDFVVEAIHGRLASRTREAIMNRFRDGKTHVLVATTVIEVGVDVPNATMMVVEHAERFGLAQLHQLRGRIGRRAGGPTSVCVFIADPTTEQATERMAAIAQTNNGFDIAEHDLAIRGIGEFFGTRQHGAPPLRVARIPDDLELLQLAKQDAKHIVDEDPDLARDDHQLLRKVLVQYHGDALGLIDVG